MRDLEIDAIQFWDRQLSYEEQLQFRYFELKKTLYKKLGISFISPAILEYKEFLPQHTN